jgi:PAS domain S-box-containing protein
MFGFMPRSGIISITTGVSPWTKRTNTVPAPTGVVFLTLYTESMKTQIQEIIDFEKVDNLLEGFYKTTGFLTAILDLDGNVLSKSGWRKICTDFHRVNPDTANNCRISDTVLANKMAEGENFHYYQCLNGLVDVAVPIVIKGEHIANLFTGQFFFETPDISFFEKQAQKYGFNKKSYLEALKNVPVVSKEEVQVAMDFLLDVTKLISEMTLQRQEQIELNIALKESEERFKALHNASFGGIVIHDKGIIMECNQGLSEMTGYVYDELIGMDVLLLIAPESRDLVMKKILSGYEKTYEADGLRKNVERYPMRLEARNVPYKGKIVRTVEFRDITEQKKSEEKLIHFHNLMHYIIEHDRSAVAVHDKNLNYVYVSQSYLDQYNVKEHDIIGKHHYEVFPEIPEKWREVHRRALKGEVLSADADPFLRADGHIDWTRWECRPWYEADGTIGGIIIYTEVINERIKQEHEIKKLNKKLEILFDELELRVHERTQQLEAANKELETFTYSVSHDLKAPLRGIDGYSKLLLDIYGNQLNDEAKHFIATIRNSTLQMNQLIEDLLQYSRLERSQVKKERVLLKPVVEMLLDMNTADLDEHGFKIETNIPDIEIICDPSGLQIALRNLIANAIKFSKKSDNPTININFKEDEKNWFISVTDNGVGFDMKYSKRIFEIFQRLHRAEDYPGTGIGLAMVAKAMNRMGGKVSARGELNKGAKFILELPKTEQ